MIAQHVQDRIADTAAATASGSLIFGLTIGQINQYLQTIAFVVSIVTGLFAIRYYIRRAGGKNGD